MIKNKTLNLYVLLILFLNVGIPLLPRLEIFSFIYFIPLVFIPIQYGLYIFLLSCGIIEKNIKIILLTILAFLVGLYITTIPPIDYYAQFYFNIELADTGRTVTPFENYMSFLIFYYRAILPVNVLLLTIIKRVYYRRGLLDGSSKK